MQNIYYLTPVVTALTKEGEIDEAGNRAAFEFVINGGSDGLLILGSTGEFFALRMDQKKQLARIAAEVAADRCRLLLGVSSTCFDEVVELAGYAEELGIREVVLISPYYFGLSDAQIERFYEGAAERIRQDIIIYNYPGRTQHDISPDNLYRLAKRHKNIVGIKDTVEVIGHTRAILQKMRPEFPEFQVYSGYDDHFMHNVMSGGNGAIGGLSNIAPEKTSEFVRVLKAADFEKAAACQKWIDAMMEIYDVTSPYFLAAKVAMRMRGVEISPACSFPLGELTAEETERLEKLMRRGGLL